MQRRPVDMNYVDSVAKGRRVARESEGGNAEDVYEELGPTKSLAATGQGPYQVIHEPVQVPLRVAEGPSRDRETQRTAPYVAYGQPSPEDRPHRSRDKKKRTDAIPEILPPARKASQQQSRSLKGLQSKRDGTADGHRARDADSGDISPMMRSVPLSYERGNLGGDKDTRGSATSTNCSFEGGCGSQGT